MARAFAPSLNAVSQSANGTCQAQEHGSKRWLGLVRAPAIDAPLWLMLAALSAVAAMSQAFRTVATVVAGELKLIVRTPSPRRHLLL